jgi:hypothetical protein
VSKVAANRRSAALINCNSYLWMSVLSVRTIIDGANS